MTTTTAAATTAVTAWDRDTKDGDGKTAEDMEFYDALTEEYDYFLTRTDSGKRSDEDDELLAHERDWKKREEIRKELDARTGRLWEDPWKITDDDWSSGKSYDDLPDWTTDICSRVSLDKVQLYPRKFSLSLPIFILQTHIHTL